MSRTLTWTVGPLCEGLTVEQFLRARGCSHHVLVHLKQTEHGILLGGSRAYTSQKLNAGDELTIQITEDQPSAGILPVRLPLDIVYEDEDLLVVNKPSGMPVHPSVHNYENTLANALMYYFTARNIPFVFRCINRLDRDTSGLLIIARHGLSGAVLSEMSAARQIHREYLAVVEGILPESGTIDAPIARLEGSALMRCVDRERGQRAVTHFRRLAVCPPGPAESIPDFAGQSLSGTADAAGMAPVPESGAPLLSSGSGVPLSLASITLETGRTHQIRVHMSHIGHPLAGDFLYNPDSAAPISRQALHSHRLEFAHPVTGEPLSFTCEMPLDMQNLIRPLRG